MLWILGWPITERFMLDFAKRHQFADELDRVDELSLCSATVSYITAHTGCGVMSCWVDHTTMLVFEISSYEGRRSWPPTWVKPSDLPPIEDAARLMRLLGVNDVPHWFLYNDGSEISYEAYESLRWDELEKDPTSEDDGFSSDEDWDSEGDDTVVASSDNGEDEDNFSDDGNDSCSEFEVSGTHEDAVGDEPLSALSVSLNANCSI